MSDGNLANEEYDFILGVADRMYISPEIVQNVIQFTDDIDFYLPPNTREKVDNIYDYVCMTIVDGEINQKEVAMCKLIAAKLGFRPVIIDDMINGILESISKGIEAEVYLSKLLNNL